MRALTFAGVDQIEWRDAPDSKLQGDGEALVKPLAVATCDLDQLIVRGMIPFEEPFPIGHECVAEVTEVGDGVEGFRRGDIVSVPFQISCGECDRCRRGNTGNCERVERMAMYGLPMGTNYGGFLSDSARVPFADAMLVGVPDGIEPEAIASLSDNIPDAWRTVGPQLAERPGSPVLICGGAASIALYATGIALALGAERVDFAGGNSYIRKVAEEIGATMLDEELPEEARSLSDHRRRQRRPRRTALRAALDRRRRDLHLDRDLLRGRLTAPLTHVHGEHPLRHWALPRPPGDGAAARPGQVGEVRARAGDRRDG